MSIIKFLRDLSKSDSPLKTLGLTTLAIAGYFGVKAACESICNYVKSRIKIKEAKDIADIEAEKYARKKEADAKFLEQKAGIDVERKRQIMELRSQDETVNDAEVVEAVEVPPSTPTLVPLKEALHKDDQKLSWLVGNLIEEGGRCILFGPPGIGKSIFALQLAISIANGSKYSFLPPEEGYQHEGQQVIYIDLELSMAEQRARIKGTTIPDNLFRNEKEICSLDELFAIIKEGCRAPKCTVIIDNLRKLAETNQAYQVNEYYRKLELTQKTLMEQGSTVTFITFTHTNKSLDVFKPIDMSNMAGGADLARFATSIYALVQARDGEIMFKQLKGRNSASMNGVYVLRIVDMPYSHLEYVRSCKEEDALPVKPKASKSTSNENTKMKGNKKVTDEQRAEIIRLHDEEGLTYEELAKMFGVSVRTISRIHESHRDNKRHDNNKSK